MKVKAREISGADGAAGTVDSCQMLIKAKERKTRWSLPRRVSQVEIWSVFPPHHQAATTSDDIPRGERVPGFLSCGSYNGGGEGFTTYRLSVVMRQPAYARIAVTTLGWLLAIELGDRLIDSTRWGIKKEKKKK